MKQRVAVNSQTHRPRRRLSLRLSLRPGPIRACLVAAITAIATPLTVLAAGPLPEQWIPTESDWVVHVDAERLAKADALKPVFDALAASGMGASLTDMGIDAAMDVTAITMFGTINRGSAARGETTTVLQGGPALRAAILHHVERHGGYTLVLRGSQTTARDVDAWTIDSLAVHIALVRMPVEAAEDKEHGLVAVLSDNAERLRTNIDELVSDRDQPAPATPGPLAVPSPWEQPLSVLHGRQPPEDAVLFVCARKLNESQPPPTSGLLASAESLVAHLGYTDDDGAITVFAELELEGHDQANMDAVVASFNHMIQYWTDRIAERSRTQPEMRAMLPLINACQVSHDNRVVRLRLERVLSRAEPAAPPARSGLAGGARRDPPT